MTSTDDIELRTVVKFCVGLKLSLVETLKQIESLDPLPACGKTYVKSGCIQGALYSRGRQQR